MCLPAYTTCANPGTGPVDATHPPTRDPSASRGTLLHWGCGNKDWYYVVANALRGGSVVAVGSEVGPGLGVDW